MLQWRPWPRGHFLARPPARPGGKPRSGRGPREAPPPKRRRRPNAAPPRGAANHRPQPPRPRGLRRPRPAPLPPFPSPLTPPTRSLRSRLPSRDVPMSWSSMARIWACADILSARGRPGPAESRRLPAAYKARGSRPSPSRHSRTRAATPPPGTKRALPVAVPRTEDGARSPPRAGPADAASPPPAWPPASSHACHARAPALTETRAHASCAPPFTRSATSSRTEPLALSDWPPRAVTRGAARPPIGPGGFSRGDWAGGSAQAP